MRKGAIAFLAIAALAVGSWFVFRRFDQRQVERESHTVTQAIERVARLSTVEMNVSGWQLRRDAKKLFGFVPITCEKTVAVFYRGKVAAGFDLTRAGSVSLTFTINGTGRHALVKLPPAQILYVDAPAPDLVVADGSVCNPLDGGDYARLHAEARTALEREALGSGILRRAEEQARDLIRAVILPGGYDVDVQIAPPAPVPSVVGLFER